jgi:type IV secretory pathway VirB10-like protein
MDDLTGDLEGSVKRCGYCDKLVRWTTIEGKSTAVNKDNSRHQCLVDKTAKRHDKPIKHPRPTAAEVAEFLAPSQAQPPAPAQPAQPAQSQAAPKAESGPQAQSPKSDDKQATDSTGPAKVKEFGQDPALILAASNRELAESNRQLAAAMVKVAESNNAIAESNKRLAESYGKFAAAITGTGQR